MCAFFFTQREADAAVQGKRVYTGPLSKESMDHPLHMPPGTQPSVMDYTRLQAAPVASRPTGFAGHASVQSTSVRTVLTGDEAPTQARRPAEPRHAYRHPTYAIHPSRNGDNVKGLLYGNEPAAAAPAAPPGGRPAASGDSMEARMEAAYLRLAASVPHLPRDADGYPDQHAVHAALLGEGFDVSAQGLAELLARCDIAPEGFPPINDFFLCLSRPGPPPDAPESASSAPPPAPAAPAAPPLAPPPAASVPAPAELAPAAAAPLPVSAKPPTPNGPVGPTRPDGQQQTWGQMQMQQQLQKGKQVAPYNGVGFQPGFQPRSGAHPLGYRSNVPALGNNIGSIYAKKSHAASQKFSSSFPADAFW